MVATDQACMLFRSPGALLLAAFGTAAVAFSGGGGLAAQEAAARRFVGTPLPALEDCEAVRGEAGRQARVDPQAGAAPQDDGSAHLLVMLPRNRSGLLATERSLAKWARELDVEAVRIDAVLPSESAEFAGIQSRGPRGRHARWIDRRGTVARWFEAVCGEDSGPRYALADADRRLLRAGRLDDGVRHECADAATGRLDLASAARIAGLSPVGAEAAAMGRDGRAAEEHLHWSQVVARIEHIAWPKGEKELRRVVDDALRRFGERPVWMAHVAEAVLGHSPALAASTEVRKVLAQGLRRAPLDPTLRRAAFRIHAGVADDRRARGHGMAWLEACKGVPGRCGEVLDALERMDRGTERFADLTARVFELGLDAGPEDSWLAKKAFEHFAARSDSGSEALDYGMRYVRTLHGDSQALNSFAWKLLTRDGYVGKHRELALAAARAMETDPHWRAYWRVDTLALACFENGRFEEAVQLQREAIEAADGSAVGRYGERLERYQRALADSRR